MTIYIVRDPELGVYTSEREAEKAFLHRGGETFQDSASLEEKFEESKC
tara:strand:+ start:308 stop:451 length:144 start_codon:yes stop_codon:yes gene_type:complete